ncbi:MAG: Gx transporter family protein [Lachnospiraceae bacterium]|nr:Gx transporter family protein [Lachnospiraceae bacterium]MDE7200393.1 Gx transporter family protein [Lachnospiraceae bacterium]
MTTKRVAYCAMLTALAMIFGYVEALIPFGFGIPGVKLGLANIVIVLALYILPMHQVFVIQLMRIVLVSFLFGNLSMMLYSLAGGILSLLVMFLLKKGNVFSITGISIAGGVSHNVGQLVMAVMVVQNLKIAFYFPALMIAGLITGCLIGILAYRIKPVLDKHAEE